jgi:hypothetical protein
MCTMKGLSGWRWLASAGVVGESKANCWRDFRRFPESEKLSKSSGADTLADTRGSLYLSSRKISWSSQSDTNSRHRRQASRS